MHADPGAEELGYVLGQQANLPSDLLKSMGIKVCLCVCGWVWVWVWVWESVCLCRQSNVHEELAGAQVEQTDNHVHNRQPQLHMFVVVCVLCIECALNVH